MARHMKHSGIEWLGDIPDHWDCCKLKYLISSLNSGTSITATDLTEDGYPVYGGGQQIGFFSQFNIEDTLIIGRVGSCGHVTKILGKAWATDNALIVTTDFPINYLYYILVAAELNELSTSNAQPLITSRKVLNHKVAVCWDKDEQERIAAYLDDKCGRIDSVISKTRATVDEYKKLKQAIITRAVTRGIRPNRTLQHSGIDWLGDIPDHWNVKKIKMCISFVNGFAFESSVLEKEGTYPVIRIGDIKNGTVDFMNANFINESTLQLEPFRIKKNDILIAMSGATVGKLAYITDEPPISFINQRVGIIRSSLGKFIYYCLSTDNFMKYILLLSEGTAQPNISTKNINNYYITIPPIDEQREIAAYLDEKTSAIDSLVAKKNQLVTELERLKKSLIFEYVTGKKEVTQ